MRYLPSVKCLNLDSISIKDSLECLRFVTFTVSLTDGRNFISLPTAFTGIAVETTIGDNGTTRDRGQFLVKV